MNTRELIPKWLAWKSDQDGERYTQKRLAIEARINETTISNILNGRTVAASATIRKIALALNITESQFLSGPPPIDTRAMNRNVCIDGQKVRNYREAKGLSVEQLAVRANLSVMGMEALEDDADYSAPVRLANMLCSLLGVGLEKIAVRQDHCHVDGTRKDVVVTCAICGYSNLNNTSGICSGCHQPLKASEKVTLYQPMETATQPDMPPIPPTPRELSAASLLSDIVTSEIDALRLRAMVGISHCSKKELLLLLDMMAAMRSNEQNKSAETAEDYTDPGST